MPDRADAHIHLFEDGFQGWFPGRDGVRIDEPALYASLADEHHVKQALVVGYEGQEWAVGNNEYLARMAAQHDWVRPVAYIDPRRWPDLDTLKKWRRQGFVGISLYIFDDHAVEALGRIPDDAWSWIIEHRWLISVNSQGQHLKGWLPILQNHNRLRLIVSHLGLPPRVADPPSPEDAGKALDDLIALAGFEGPHVKLSGFYALTEPGHAYPHHAAWPYVQALGNAFGTKRLLWGSDFTPSLDFVTFPQTHALFAEIPFLKGDERRGIEGGNLLSLLQPT
ncbi:MAG: amidohydrolase family protein [Planctomycetota bacterium]|jgi:predicted TIM-barrel fold metal-dependent hydrolase